MNIRVVVRGGQISDPKRSRTAGNRLYRAGTLCSSTATRVEPSGQRSRSGSLR